ncbi:MAG: GDYXXLXY domain-containing protein [Saprospiraceae bacterium]|nr:GDYXXLXY domain-containing protein [Saprospiraceae bacterium]
MTKLRNVFLLLFFWGVVLIGFIIYKERVFQTGTDIVLQTVPVDPRDLFRGDYVELQYDISRLDLDTLGYSGAPFTKDETVYLLLEIVNDFASPVKVSREKFKDGLFIRGTVESSYGHIINVAYGIEHYFVEEGKGKEIERERGRMSIQVTVDKSGTALIKKLLPEEKPK